MLFFMICSASKNKNTLHDTRRNYYSIYEEYLDRNTNHHCFSRMLSEFFFSFSSFLSKLVKRVLWKWGERGVEERIKARTSLWCQSRNCCVFNFSFCTFNRQPSLKRVKIIIKQNQRKSSTKDIDEQSEIFKVTTWNKVVVFLPVIIINSDLFPRVSKYWR